MRKALAFVLVQIGAISVLLFFSFAVQNLFAGTLGDNARGALRSLLIAGVLALLAHRFAAKLTDSGWVHPVPYLVCVGASLFAAISGGAAFVWVSALLGLVALIAWKMPERLQN